MGCLLCFHFTTWLRCVLSEGSGERCVGSCELDTREGNLNLRNPAQSKILKNHLNSFHTLLDFPSFHLGADIVFRSQKEPFFFFLLSDSQRKDKCSMAKKKRSEQYYEVHVTHKGSASAQRGFIFNTSPDSSAKKVHITPPLSRFPGQIRPRPARGRRYLRVSFPPVKISGARGQRSPFLLFFFLFFSRQECVVARSSAEVNRIVWSSGNSVSMTSSESSQEWKGGGGGGEGGRKSPPREKMEGFESEVLG